MACRLSASDRVQDAALDFRESRGAGKTFRLFMECRVPVDGRVPAEEVLLGKRSAGKTFRGRVELQGTSDRCTCGRSPNGMPSWTR